MARKSFIIYNSWETGITKLSPEEQVLFLKRMFDAHQGRELTPIPEEMVRLDIFWDAIEFNVTTNLEKYDKQVERVSKARKSNPKVRNQDSLSKESNDNDNDNDNANANVDVSVKEDVKVKVNKYLSEDELKQIELIKTL
jgi:hypothetical protein